MKKITVVIALFCWFVQAYAEGEYKAGEQKASTCVACHGPAGVSLNPEWPSLAGQHALYVVKQLHDYKPSRGTRPQAIMASIVAELSDQDIEDLAVFYASQPIPEGVTPKAYLKRGEELYRGGDYKKGIAACIACHGPRGMGNAQAKFPALSGQHAEYTIQQLQAFKNGQRKNDLNDMMQNISARMSLDDMEAVAHYVAGLH